MNILVLSQVFWPDTASTSQHLSDLADRLSMEHDVTVITSRNNYENPQIKYPKRERKGNISIIRLANSGFGKTNTLARLADFTSYNILLLFRLLAIHQKRTNLIIGL